MQDLFPVSPTNALVPAAETLQPATVPKQPSEESMIATEDTKPTKKQKLIEEQPDPVTGKGFPGYPEENLLLFSYTYGTTCIPIYEQDRFRLQESIYLCDSLITLWIGNFHMNILKKSFAGLVYFMPTTFYSMLMEKDVYSYNLVERWTKTENVNDLFKKKYVIIPINNG